MTSFRVYFIITERFLYSIFKWALLYSIGEFSYPFKTGQISYIPTLYLWIFSGMLLFWIIIYNKQMNKCEWNRNSFSWTLEELPLSVVLDRPVFSSNVIEIKLYCKSASFISKSSYIHNFPEAVISRRYWARSFAN